LLKKGKGVSRGQGPTHLGKARVESPGEKGVRKAALKTQREGRQCVRWAARKGPGVLNPQKRRKRVFRGRKQGKLGRAERGE